jgi:hypothetical protein
VWGIRIVDEKKGYGVVKNGQQGAVVLLYASGTRTHIANHQGFTYKRQEN